MFSVFEKFLLVLGLFRKGWGVNQRLRSLDTLLFGGGEQDSFLIQG